MNINQIMSISNHACTKQAPVGLACALQGDTTSLLWFTVNAMNQLLPLSIPGSRAAIAAGTDPERCYSLLT